MIQPKYTPEEALAKVKLMMKYDLSKTLNENAGIVYEQYTSPYTSNNPLSGDENVDKILRMLYNGVANNKEDIIKSLALIKNKQTYDKVNQFLLKTPIGSSKSIKDILNFKFGNQDLYYANQAKEYLKAAGLVLSFSLSDERVQRGGTVVKGGKLVPGSFMIGVSSSLTPPNKDKTKQTKGSPSNTKKSQYKPCKGTYTIGCISDSIKKIQACLGLVVDGKYGRNTNAKLKEIGYNSFTDSDISKICGGSTQGQTTDQSTGQSPWMKSQLEKIRGEKSSFGSTTPSIGSTTPSTDNKAPEIPAEDSMDIINNN